ncbi:MAG TPA: caspase family protein [Candidatus Bacteroides pullicola]|uniref:Caspase family protein n=1 Tax=Candidatus Bacteroides pullicola TaxID=2838475 RepID=A0A9D1ZHF1_9BACE|nr:caspase family protein [Candidatus Bacteroides pullicola]
MKLKRLFWGALAASCLYGMPLSAQSTDKATAAYREFVRLNNEGADKANVYSALYRCYTEYVSVLSSAQAGTAAYQEAKSALRDIYPYLQNGAIYNSQHGNQQNALIFAQAYMDVPLMDAFAGESFTRDDYFATMASFAAFGTYDISDYAKAIPYFRAYLETGDTKNRKDVYAYMAMSYLKIGNFDLAKNVLDEAMSNYPTDFNLLSIAINACIDSKDYVNLQKYVTKALAQKPQDNTLLNIQGKLYEDTQQYQQALNTYLKLRRANPRSLDVARHVALNYYNLGVLNYNKASMEQSASSAKKYDRQAKEYFTAAAATLEDIVASDPMSVKYLEALATAYSCMGEADRLSAVNSKIASLGGQTVQASSMPSMMAYSGKKVQQDTPMQNMAQATPSAGAVTHQEYASVTTTGEPPRYSQYAKEYVESRIERWQTKDPYETVDEYKARVTQQTRDAKIKELLKEAEAEYIKTYTADIRFTDMLLKPYDAENRVFLVESKYGELIVPVPREHNEAQVFESSWAGMQFKDPKFYINNDKLMLSSLTFVTPTGDTYRYDGDESLNYTETVVDMNFSDIDTSKLVAEDHSSNTPGVRRSKTMVSVGKSDVDTDIPESKEVNDKTFAYIIANEDYSMVAPVPMAQNDGQTFGEYCRKTLGLPETNVRYYPNASYGIMLSAIQDLKNIAKVYDPGEINVIFYYAGHGVPNEATKDAFLLPIDANGQQTEVCYSLNKLYSELAGLNANSVVVFLDACFSGAGRDGDMLASARGVALKAKAEKPQGNMVIFSAASGDETAYPFKEKGHGLFTYYLLKKLQESKGNATLQEIGDYVTEEVRRQSQLVNHKLQTPTVSASTAMGDSWKNMKLK